MAKTSKSDKSSQSISIASLKKPISKLKSIVSTTLKTKMNKPKPYIKNKPPRDLPVAKFKSLATATPKDMQIQDKTFGIVAKT